jgi:hypothetical protein
VYHTYSSVVESLLHGSSLSQSTEFCREGGCSACLYSGTSYSAKRRIGAIACGSSNSCASVAVAQPARLASANVKRQRHESAAIPTQAGSYGLTDDK